MSQVVWAGTEPGVVAVAGYFVDFAIANLLELVPANTGNVPQTFGVEGRQPAVYGQPLDQGNNVCKLTLDILRHFNEWFNNLRRCRVEPLPMSEERFITTMVGGKQKCDDTANEFQAYRLLTETLGRL